MKLFPQPKRLSNLVSLQPDRLLKYHGLHYVTSSLEKKAVLSNAEGSTPQQDKSPAEPTAKMEEGNMIHGENVVGISASVAYRIVASAAAYLQSQTKNVLPQRTQRAERRDDPSISAISNEDEAAVTSSQMASFVATTNSVTAVIAGEEEMKDAVAEDLNSASSSPCEWFICDDDKSRTRYFVIQVKLQSFCLDTFLLLVMEEFLSFLDYLVDFLTLSSNPDFQGSESLAAWQANLLFEPVLFEVSSKLVEKIFFFFFLSLQIFTAIVRRLQFY